MSIDASQVEVRFGGVVALQDVSVRLEPGTVLAVIGPNGSGKTTLFNSITGLVRLDRGAVRVDGVDLNGMPPHRRIRLGIGRTFQTPRFDPTTTVMDAVLCGFYPVKRSGVASVLLGLPAANREERDLQARCCGILDDLGLLNFAETPMSKLPMGHVRLVEVARAIANLPKYLLLDEPAAGLTIAEQTRLGTEIRRLAAAGVGVLLVEHNFGLVQSVADDVLVLDRGRELCRGTSASVAQRSEFVEIYLGTSGQRS
jgi:branched-chain amino acid transport system ATP-binding protein